MAKLNGGIRTRTGLEKDAPHIPTQAQGNACDYLSGSEKQQGHITKQNESQQPSSSPREPVEPLRPPRPGESSVISLRSEKQFEAVAVLYSRNTAHRGIGQYVCVSPPQPEPRDGGSQADTYIIAAGCSTGGRVTTACAAGAPYAGIGCTNVISLKRGRRFCVRRESLSFRKYGTFERIICKVSSNIAFIWSYMSTERWDIIQIEIGYSVQVAWTRESLLK